MILIWNFFFINAFKTFIKPKNILKIFTCFFAVLCIIFFLKNIEVNFGWFKSDFFFNISSYIGISVIYIIKIHIELNDIPDINLSIVKVFIKSPFSVKIQLFKDFLSLFNGPINKDIMTMAGADPINSN